MWSLKLQEVSQTYSLSVIMVWEKKELQEHWCLRAGEEEKRGEKAVKETEGLELGVKEEIWQ